MRTLIRKLILWALGGEPVMRAPEPPYDPAALDKVVRELQGG